MIEIIVGILTVLLIVQQYQIHLLVNKLMSRNYYDYEITKKSIQLMDEGGAKNTTESEQQQNDDSFERDLNYLGM